MNLLSNKKLLILPVIIIVSLVFSSFLFFNQIEKLKKQIDNLYFATFTPVHKLHNIARLYEKTIYIKNISKNDKNKIIKDWKYYFTSYKTKNEMLILNKINVDINNSFKKYDDKLLSVILKEINSLIVFEVEEARLQRKSFLLKYVKMNDYLTYSLVIILLLSLILVAYIIFLNLQKHTELEKLTNKYKIDSITDSLSSLYNRKHFDKVFSKMPIIAYENNWTCAFVMVDIDFFKPFNDTYGHDMGDMVIKSVANTLKESFNKKYEYVFRIGGEEFGIIVFDISVEKLKKSLDNFASNIKELNIEHSASDTNILTVSMGVSLVDEYSSNIDTGDIYKKADNKLYHSKENGRNQYTI